MPYIIDGNNLIGCAPDFSLEEDDSREKILDLIRRYQRLRKSSMIVVFDGEPSLDSHKQKFTSKFTVIYPKFGHTADEEIKHLMNGYTDCQGVRLVTSDKELKSFAKNKGAKTLNSIEFFYELKRINHAVGKKEEAQKRIDTQVSENEVDQWLKIFDSE